MQTTATLKPATSKCILCKYPVKQECHEEKTPLMLPIFLMIPFEEKSSVAPKTSPKQTKTGVNDIQTSEFSHLKFPEMRNGILSTRCHCVHRDGLQDSCPLSQCQKEPECLDKPWPSCLPAKYLQSRHPEQYPPSKQ
ncbi:uncharacterized protein [Bombus fervidus]|uniref:uncharacterized protein n=1 Tax=Bombus fervidus TaxID=203811 RepID=UPI003AB4D9B8